MEVGSVDYLKITEDKSSENKSLYSRREANHNHSYKVKAQSMEPAPQHQYSTKTRGPKPASSNVQSQHLKREARSPRSDYREAPYLGYNCPHYWVNYCSRKEGS